MDNTLQDPRLSARSLAFIVGKIISMSPVLGNLSRIMTRDCQMSVAAAQDWDSVFPLDRHCMVKLQFGRIIFALLTPELPFLGTEIRKCNGRLETRVYRKPTDTGLLLHYKRHVDVRYKTSLLVTMLDRAFEVSSTWQLFHLECDRLTHTFFRLQYPAQLLQSTISNFVTKKVSGEQISTRASTRSQRKDMA